MRVVITGPHGYIAKKLCSHLCDNRVDAALISLRDGAWHAARFSGDDTVVHLAGAAHNSARTPAEFYQINAALTAKLARKAKDEGVKHFIFVSSMAVYGAENVYGVTNRITACTPLAPKTPYGTSKLEGERAVREIFGDGACIVRPPMVYGENCTGNYRLLRKLALRVRIVPRVDNSRGMIYVYNLCEFLRLLITNGDTGIFHPQDIRAVTTYKLAQEIGRLNGVDVRAVDLPFMRLAAKLLPSFGKAFGSLAYAPEIAAYGGGDYRMYSAEQALERTEKLWQ